MDIKSLPIDEMDIFKSKILLNILLTIPISKFIAIKYLRRGDVNE